ncbi:MAG: ABC transporter permease, partial [Pyrinomonadaceae bacterium]
RLDQPAYTYRYDPTRPESRTARLEVDAAFARAAGQPHAVGAREEQLSASGARYIDFLVPGLIGLNLMGSGMWGLGFSIVTARGRKLLKRFAATPMRRSDYLLSFILSRLVFLCLEVAAVLVFAWLVFGVRIHGSIVGVGLVALLGGMTFSGIGLLVAARPSTIEGVSGLMNFVMLPMWLLSGTFFSSERFPAAIQPFVKALPLTAVNDALRALINDGAPLAAQWPQVLILIAWALISFVVALRIFRWQ